MAKAQTSGPSHEASPWWRIRRIGITSLPLVPLVCAGLVLAPSAWAQSSYNLLVGSGGSGGGDGGTGGVTGGSGGQDFYLAGPGGGTALSGTTQTVSTPYEIDGTNPAGILSVVIGGGAGGGDGGNQGGINGSNGGNGDIDVTNGGTLDVTQTLRIGGAGGGGGSGGAGFTRGGSGGSGGSGTLNVTGGSTVIVGDQLTIGGPGGAGGNCGCSGNGGAGGAGVLNLGDGSSLELTGATFTINGDGMLNIGNATPNGTTAGTVTGLSGGVTDNGAINFNQSDTAYTFSTVISGTGTVTQNGSGTTVLTGANSYTGGTTITGGLINFSTQDNLGTGNITLNGGGLQWATGNTADISGRLAALGEAGGTFDTNGNDVTLASGINGSGGLTKSGSGVLALSGANGYTGGTTVNAGTLALSGGGSIASSSGLALSSGAGFDISGTTSGATLQGLTGSGGVNLGSMTLTIDNTADDDFDGAISGAGGLIKAGAGTLALTNTSSYIGGTTVDAGTLALSGNGSIASSSNLALSSSTSFDISGTTSGATLQGLTGSGNVNLSSKALTIANAAADVFDGVISGAGAVTKSGSGTLTLTGNNLYTGGTDIQAGTLALAGNGTAGTGAIDVADGATFDISQAGNGTSAIALNGAGSVALGAQTLTVGSGAANSNFSGSITNGGIGGGTGGKLVVTGGTGEVVFSGVNTYTGGTEISSGTLALTGNGALYGTSAVAIDAGGIFDISGITAGNTTIGDLDGTGTVNLGAKTLAVNEIDNTTFSGTLEGSGGSLLKQGDGTLTLTGANPYTGGTTINNGVLAIAADGSLYSAGPVSLTGSSAAFDISGASSAQTIGALSGAAGSNVDIGNNALTFGDGGDTKFAGSFTGAGKLVKQGSGMLTLNGDSSGFTGSTSIVAGTLEVGDATDDTAILGGAVAVASGATLRGHGTIGGDVVNDGIVQPGGSIGILTVAGDYTQNSSGTLSIEVTPSTVPGTGYDQLQVEGSASLAGALAVQVDNGTYIVGSQYDILHAAGGVSGSFAATSYNPAYAAYITPVVTYSANDVTLELTPTPAPPTAPTPPAAPVNYSNSLAFSSGQIYAASSFAQDASLFDAVASPLEDSAAGAAAAGAGTDHGYWLHGLGSFGHAGGYNINEKGYVIGKGFAISPNLVLGLAVSNLYTSTSDAASSVDGTSFGALGYGIYTRGRLTVSASAGVGHLATNINRGLPTLGETAKAASNGAYEAAALRMQYRLGGPRFFTTPYGSASYLHTGMGSATETGASILDLRYDAMSTSLAELGGGVMAGLDLPVRYGTLTPWVQLGGEGTLGNAHVRNTETLGAFSAGETALAAPVGAFTPAAGVELAGQGQWRIAAACSGQFSSASSVENFSLEGRYVW